MMAGAVLITCTALCVLVFNSYEGVASSIFPLEDCLSKDVDLKLIANSVRDGFAEQMRLFSLLIDLFQSSEQQRHGHRIQVVVLVYRITQENSVKYQQVFNYTHFNNNTQAKEFLQHISYEDVSLNSRYFNWTFENVTSSTIFHAQESVNHIIVMVVEYSQIRNLFKNSFKNLDDRFKFFIIVVDDTPFKNPIKIEQLHYIRVNDYASLEHVQDIPVSLCGACFPEWFGFEQHNIESMVWTHSCYTLVVSDDRISWSDSLKSCEKKKSTLASIETEEELEFLRDILTNKTQKVKEKYEYFDAIATNFPVQIGLIRDRDSLSKRFKWINNMPLTVTHWRDQKPNGGYVQSCGAWIFGIPDNPDGWDDFGCGYKNAHLYLCEANSVTYNTGFILNSTVKNTHLENIHTILQRGELAWCPESDALVSVSGIIHEKSNGDCVLFSQQKVNTLTELSSFIPLFECDDQNKTVLAYSFVCDHKTQCPNKRDEEVCKYRLCDWKLEFTCKSKQCVPAEARCDLYQDCFDGSDEVDCTDCKFMQCQDGSCLPTHWFYDDEVDCIWGDFSIGYNWNIDLPEDGISEMCVFMCNRTQCVTEEMLNNNVVDCTGPEGPLDETVGSLGKTNIYANSSVLNPMTWPPKCVYYRDRYDSPLGFRRMTHLQDCLEFLCPEGYLKCPGSYCIPMHQSQDGKKDCPYGEDEMKEFFLGCKGNFLCMSSRICVYVDQVCDGYPHCPQGDDELNCQISCKEGFTCITGAVTVYNYDKIIPPLSLNFIDSRITFIDLSGVNLSGIFPDNLLEVSLENLNTLRLSGCSIESLDIEFNREIYFGGDWFKLAAIHTLDLSHNHIEYIDEYSVIKVMYNLRIIDLSHNRILWKINPKAFELNIFPSSIQFLDLSYTHLTTTLNIFDPLVHLKYLNLSNTQLSDLKPGTFSNAGTVRLKVLDLTNIAITDFYPDTFSGVYISSGLYSDTYRLCCPQVHGPGIPSDVCYAPEDLLSTCTDLMGDGIKRVLLWLVATLAIIGNLVVILYRIKFARPLLKKAYGMCVVHLAVSDFIMGAYLLIVASADTYYRGVYIWNERRWRHSALCQIAGFLSVLSSEVSICFVLMITVDRFLVLKYPFSEVKLSRRIAIIISVLIWLLGFIVALVPLFPEFEHWSTYSSNGMCLGLPLTCQKLPGWQFSSAVFIGFNFFMFAFIVIGQISIYRIVAAASKSHRDMLRLHNVPQQQDFAAARQLFLIAMSNFVCWFPIGVIGLVSLQGYAIGASAYAWSAVLILPINSALNPVLYTIPALFRKCATCRRGGISTRDNTSGNRHLCYKCQMSFVVSSPADNIIRY